MPQCSKRVWGDLKFHQCPRQGKIERDGQWYCGQHDPVAKKERDNKRQEQWEEQWAIKNAAWKRQRICLEVCEGVETDTLEAITGNGGLKAILEGRDANR